MTGRWRKVSAVAGGCFVVLFVIAGMFQSAAKVGHHAIPLHLKLIGDSIYEFHTKTGRWPTRAEDLADTSLPQQSPRWKEMLDNEAIVALWRQDLKPDPADNAKVILTYHNRGLLASMGRVWVCWGDLRTEYIPVEELRRRLPDN